MVVLEDTETLTVGPVSAEQAAARSTSFDSLCSFGSSLWWVEAAPGEGRSVVRSWPSCQEMLADFAVGSAVHGYGGGAYTISETGVWSVSADDGQVWRVDTAERCTDSPYSHADLAWHDGVIMCVRERPECDELVVIEQATSGEAVVWQADFLAAPQLSDDRMAWSQWSAAVMPWDSSEVWVADYRTRGALRDAKRIAGGPAESATQPRWGPDGWLYFLSDRTGWWNLYRFRDGVTEPVASMEVECGPAPWELGYRSYDFLPGGQVAMITQEGPTHRLVVVDRGGNVREIVTPYTFVKPYLAVVGGKVAFIGSSPTLPQQIAVVSTDGSNTVDVIRGVDQAEARGSAEPELITVASDTGEIAVIFHPPSSARGRRPAPLIVRAHPGPTHCWELRFDSEVQFFTSRGYAVADVNYRGSTGYGRSFRKALDGRWGTLDVADCCAAASHLTESGRANPQAVFISGASAGGYTALRAACAPSSPFAIAVARSAVVSPRYWTKTAPRFQRPHAAILSHEHADVDAGDVKNPVLLIHGGNDGVAPVGDVVELASELEKRDLLRGCVIFPEAGHYLSDPDVRTEALLTELNAYENLLSGLGLSQR